jgi:hypothetical protein
LWKAKVALLDETAAEEFHLLHHGGVDQRDQGEALDNQDDGCKYLKMLTSPGGWKRSLRGRVHPLSTKTPCKQKTMENKGFFIFCIFYVFF